MLLLPKPRRRQRPLAFSTMLTRGAAMTRIVLGSQLKGPCRGTESGLTKSAPSRGLRRSTKGIGRTATHHR